MEHVIIEFKARCGDHERIRAILKQKNARFVGHDHQIDSYFHVPQGRLKLREGDIENALVFYDRPNQTGPKQSDVTLSKVPVGSDVKAVLNKELGLMTIGGACNSTPFYCFKRREIYFVDNVKVHLDRFEGFWEFVEVEAIGGAN